MSNVTQSMFSSSYQRFNICCYSIRVFGNAEFRSWENRRLASSYSYVGANYRSDEGAYRGVCHRCQV
jgi:hypothetical protein